MAGTAVNFGVDTVRAPELPRADRRAALSPKNGLPPVYPEHRPRWLPLIVALIVAALISAVAIAQQHHHKRQLHQPQTLVEAVADPSHFPALVPPTPPPTTPPTPRRTTPPPAPAPATTRARVEAAHQAPQAAGRSYTRHAVPTTGSAREYASSQMSADEFACFSNIVERESGWSVTAENPSSGAYGLMQALPGSKMAAAGSDWRYSAATQIRWGIGYIDANYGSPCAAWEFWQSHGWY